MTAHALLSAPIQQALWDWGWSSLRPFQTEAIESILRTDQHVLISAPTASGKTEAAFLPILSRILTRHVASVRAIYVSPLKALINDQFRRLDELCDRLQIETVRWHGDIDAGRKKKLLNAPQGILLITPESLESLFVNHGSYLGAMFGGLEFVVIDELHAFVGSERGTQLQSQLHRLTRYANTPPRRVALSATLGPLVDPYKQWLSPEDPGRVHMIQYKASPRDAKVHVHAYCLADDFVAENSGADPGSAAEHDRMVQDLLDDFSATTNLVFCNRKEDVEELADALNRRCRQSNLREPFLVHHGSISRAERAFVEEQMRSNEPFTTLCSSTLELGLDVGKVAAVGQIGAPHSVASLVQRLGRSGRRPGMSPALKCFIRVMIPAEDPSLTATLYPELLQAIALVQLWRQGWVEPPDIPRQDYSTFVQQVLSVLAETKGAQADQLYKALVSPGGFEDLSIPDFAAILRALGEQDLVEQLPQGDLVLGLKGQKLIADLEFYAAFPLPREYRVLHIREPVGMLPMDAVPEPGDHFLLGGRPWEVQSVDQARREVGVVPSTRSRSPRFSSPRPPRHARIAQQMRELLKQHDVPEYLDERGQELLIACRRQSQQLGLHTSSIVEQDDGTTLWFPWCGTKGMRTAQAWLQASGLSAEFAWPGELAIQVKVDRDQLVGALDEIAGNPPELSAEQLERLGLYRRKNDQFVPLELLAASFIAEALDEEDALRAIGETVSSS